MRQPNGVRDLFRKRRDLFFIFQSGNTDRILQSGNTDQIPADQFRPWTCLKTFNWCFFLRIHIQLNNQVYKRVLKSSYDDIISVVYDFFD